MIPPAHNLALAGGAQVITPRVIILAKPWAPDLTTLKKAGEALTSDQANPPKITIRVIVLVPQERAGPAAHTITSGPRLAPALTAKGKRIIFDLLSGAEISPRG